MQYGTFELHGIHYQTIFYLTTFLDAFARYVLGWEAFFCAWEKYFRKSFSFSFHIQKWLFIREKDIVLKVSPFLFSYFFGAMFLAFLDPYQVSLFYPRDLMWIIYGFVISPLFSCNLFEVPIMYCKTFVALSQCHHATISHFFNTSLSLLIIKYIYLPMSSSLSHLVYTFT